MLISRADSALRKARLSAGFTLIELLLVLGVMALLAGLGSPVYSKLKAGAEYRNSVRQVMAGLVLARQQAAEFGREVRYACDLDKRVCGLDGAASLPLPEAVSLRATVAGMELKEGRAAIRFYPDGGSTGGFFELVRAGGGGTRVRVDWLFGRLTQEPVGS